MKLPDIARETLEARIATLLESKGSNQRLLTWKQIDNNRTTYTPSSIPAGMHLVDELGSSCKDLKQGREACPQEGFITVSDLVKIVERDQEYIVGYTLQELEFFVKLLLPGITSTKSKFKGVTSAVLSRPELYNRWPWVRGYGNPATALSLASAWRTGVHSSPEQAPDSPEFLKWRQDPPDITLQELQQRLHDRCNTELNVARWEELLSVPVDENRLRLIRARSLGWLLQFEKEVQQNRAVSKRVIVPTDRSNRALLQGWGNKDNTEGLQEWRKHLDKPVKSVSLQGPGSVQLVLNFGAGYNLDQEILHNIESLVSVQGGLNTYLALLYAAGNYGRSGEFSFNMADHLITIDRQNRQQARDAETNKIETMSKITVEVDFGWLTDPKTKKPRRYYYRSSLLTIPGGLYSEGGGKPTLEGATIKLCPELYRPVRERRGKLGSNWSQISRGVLRLDTRRGTVSAVARYIAIEFLFAKRHHLTPGGYWQTNGRYLLEKARLEGRYRENRREAWEALRAALNKLETIYPAEIKTWKAVDSASDLIPLEHWTKKTLFRIWPSEWFIDSTIYRVPLLEGGHSTVPNNGKELKAWRKKNGLTIAAAAREIGVSRPTFTSAEKDLDGLVSGKIRAGILARWEKLHSASQS
jgi:hypothetical protein